MSDTGEQGMQPKDPADAAGIGGGVVPDDKAEGQQQVTEESGDNSGDNKADD